MSSAMIRTHAQVNYSQINGLEYESQLLPFVRHLLANYSKCLMSKVGGDNCGNIPPYGWNIHLINYCYYSINIICIVIVLLASTL